MKKAAILLSKGSVSPSSLAGGSAAGQRRGEPVSQASGLLEWRQTGVLHESVRTGGCC